MKAKYYKIGDFLKERLLVILLENGHLTFDWEEVRKLSDEEEDFSQKIYTLFQESPAKALFHLGFCRESKELSPSYNFLIALMNEYVTTLQNASRLELESEHVSLSLTKDDAEKWIEKAPFFQGAEFLSCTLLLSWWEKAHTFFMKDCGSYNGTLQEYLLEFLPQKQMIGKVHFHLVENRDSVETPFAFLATYISLEDGQYYHRPLQYALTEYKERREELVDLLATVYAAAAKSPLITKILESGEIFYPLHFTSNEAYHFLTAVTLYEESGVLCRIPNWWKPSHNNPKASIQFGKQIGSWVGLQSLVDFDATIILGGLELTLEEARAIEAESDGLAFIKGKWIPINKEKLSQTLTHIEEAQKLMEAEGLTLAEAMRVLLLSEHSSLGELQSDEVQVGYGEWLQTLFKQMKEPQEKNRITPPKEFSATLRPYQEVGLSWLHSLGSVGFGACLADDMGLGKTIQVLALLSVLKKSKESTPTLLVVPASLIGNWVQEIEKFAASISYAVAHPWAGKEQITKEGDSETIGKQDLVITTYGLVKRYQWLREYRWNYLILDEAQAIKNPATAQTKAIKTLQGKNRLVLTGTPIENRLSDLWSLFDFLNPGLLGTKPEFIKLLKKQQGDMSRIKEVVNPFILRRLKTDKTIIADLPDKLEMETYSDLTKKQVVHYQKIVTTLVEGITNAEGIERKGLVLAALTKFKQICNHPSQYLGVSEFPEKESGKFKRLREICETIAAKREKVLVFTQFKEMTKPLSLFLEEVFGKKGLILHGGTRVKKRTELVEAFQSDEYLPFFILSIKAGGVGLNLTAANHVIHFDRWWNPAVENQATDRAFRIGQKKSVVVHKFITHGTIEEKIHKLLEEKQKLSDDILSDTQENWITEMSNDEIKDIFTLGDA